ncbi:MAG: TolC family protein, partial [Rhodocyclaceae bacterium]|nr:TolC family protein [Rhodocyclaceae bacterium]
MRMPPLLLLACLPALGWAAGPAMPPDPPDLPPAALVQKALHAHPAVRAAEAGLHAEEAQRDRLDAGPHEVTLRLANARRRDATLDRRLGETEMILERALRMPGKAARDSEIGEAGLAAARAARGDALHETARLLLRSWFDWLREEAAGREWQAQVDLLRRQAEIADRRVSAGDAARLESLLARAQLTQAEAGAAQAAQKAATARLEWHRHFPSISLPDRPAPSAPAP